MKVNDVAVINSIPSWMLHQSSQQTSQELNNKYCFIVYYLGLRPMNVFKTLTNDSYYFSNIKINQIKKFLLIQQTEQKTMFFHSI